LKAPGPEVLLTFLQTSKPTAQVLQACSPSRLPRTSHPSRSSTTHATRRRGVLDEEAAPSSEEDGVAASRISEAGKEAALSSVLEDQVVVGDSNRTSTNVVDEVQGVEGGSDTGTTISHRETEMRPSISSLTGLSLKRLTSTVSTSSTLRLALARMSRATSTASCTTTSARTTSPQLKTRNGS